MRTISVKAAGGVVWREDGDQVLVVLIKRRGLWDLPKGKVEEHETIEEAARREVSEEIGIPLPYIQAELCTTHHTYAQGDVHVAKTTWWYAMGTLARSFTPQEEEAIEAVEWVPLDEAIQRVAYENLITVLHSFAEFKGRPIQ